WSPGPSPPSRPPPPSRRPSSQKPWRLRLGLLVLAGLGCVGVLGGLGLLCCGLVCRGPLRRLGVCGFGVCRLGVDCLGLDCLGLDCLHLVAGLELLALGSRCARSALGALGPSFGLGHEYSFNGRPRKGPPSQWLGTIATSLLPTGVAGKNSDYPESRRRAPRTVIPIG